MCGITVYISKKEQDDKNLSKISHRGPDLTTIWKFKFKDYYISLAFHRLAIIDLDNGDQPFIHKDHNRQTYLLCNGEIYNYKELIDKYSLKTNSDCKVILELFLQTNDIKKTVSELDGEFAFVLIDIKDDNLNIYYCRDRFGIRPLFYYIDDSSFLFSSELKGLPRGLGKQVEPRKIHLIHNKEHYSHQYYKIGENTHHIDVDYVIMLNKIRNLLIDSVKDRMQTERPLGALLSGGLDSSLICGIAAEILKEKGERLNTFTIGIEESAPDIIYARKVAKHINSIHHEIIIPVEEWISQLKNVIKSIETYDITTIRASTGQYLVSKWVREHTDIKVLLVGEGSDETAAGYKYFYNAPNGDESHNENIRLLEEIHKYDVLRCDRGISTWGLEARGPFLSHNFVNYYLSIDKESRHPIKNQRIEKYLLRKAFDRGEKSIIPYEVLYRSKDGFSDSVSNKRKSWFEYIQEYVDTQISDEEFEINKHFPSKEAYWYWKTFISFYPESGLNVVYWMPRWCGNITDPSARVLE